MTRKIEKWADDIFPGSKEYVLKYRSLSGRELAIVAAAAIDTGLAHLIERKLVEDKKEIESFLGLSDDGRAPGGTFGARIQMAYLLGLISTQEMKIFRSMKSIRNKFAHKVNMTFLHEDIIKELVNFVPIVQIYINTDRPEKMTEKDIIKRMYEKESHGETALLVTFLCYQQRLNDKIISTKSITQTSKEAIALKELLKSIKKT